MADRFENGIIPEWHVPSDFFAYEIGDILLNGSNQNNEYIHDTKIMMPNEKCYNERKYLREQCTMKKKKKSIILVARKHAKMLEWIRKVSTM